MAKIMITGVNGFVGTHLTDALIKQEHEVIGVGIVELNDETLGKKLANFLLCDITDPNAVARLPLEDIDGIINLAGLAAVGRSFDAPDEYMHVNTAVLSVPCEEILKRGLESRIRMLAISSGGVYASDQAMPLTEDSRANSNSSPYAASKLAMEELAVQYSQRGLSCITARPFNHIGPGQGEGFLLPDLYKQLRESLNNNQPMLVGNLTTERDYTDVRDVVAAYVALITAPTLNHQLYNVCTGTPHSGQELLNILMSNIGRPADIQEDPAKFRPSDTPVLYGDHTKLSQDTGWQPKIPLEQTIQDFVGWKQTA